MRRPDSLRLVWGTLVWAAASLGVRLREETWSALDALSGENADGLALFNALSLCNIAWCAQLWLAKLEWLCGGLAGSLQGGQPSTGETAQIRVAVRCRGMAILGEVQRPAFARVVSAVVASHRQQALEPRLMRQLFQSVTTARTLGSPIDIPADLESTAYKW